MTGENIAISVRNLGKKYTIGGPQERYHTFRDAIVNSVKAPFRRLSSHESPQEFWALKDVSFEIETGDVVGIIGRNGAGKSTLLKILSRITSPTEGTVDLYGRVGSLLEVGTGFHPELTGRENIFLSGSILGMRKREIEAKLDDIIKFSEIEKFLDTPVKRYSSGMYVRLAFAVAAHLETEILLVDEVLAVGDAQFQKKCLGKMGDVATKEGRTVLFVSHNMGAVRQLCTFCILLDNGLIKDKGYSTTVIDQYLTSNGNGNSVREITIDENKEFQLIRCRIIDETGTEKYHCNCDYPILIELQIRVTTKIPGVYGYLSVNKQDGTVVMMSDSYDNEPNSLDNLDPGIHSFHIIIPSRTLGPGNYLVYLNFTSSYHISSYDVDSPGVVTSFQVFDETSMRGNKRIGFFSTKLQWKRKEDIKQKK